MILRVSEVCPKILVLPFVALYPAPLLTGNRRRAIPPSGIAVSKFPTIQPCINGAATLPDRPAGMYNHPKVDEP